MPKRIGEIEASSNQQGDYREQSVESRGPPARRIRSYGGP